MSQVRSGTADVANGSQVVSGSGTSWLTSVSANDLFIIQGESVIYRIASVASDTQLSLSSNYVGATATALPYVVHIDFTTSGIPLMQDGDIETVSIYNLAVVSLEQGLAFGTYYLGAFAVAPTETGTGGAITEGMMYFNTVTDLLNVYDGSVWYDGVVSAIAAAQSAAEAAADAILTAADRVQTGLDRVQTGLDKDQTGLDRIQTESDAAQTISDAAATAADRVQTGIDSTDTSADSVQTGLDRVQTVADAAQTALDRTQTGLDATQTAADRVQTGLDLYQTTIDSAQTSSDRVQTVADAAQTAADRVQTSADRVQTISDAASTAADRVDVNDVETRVLAIEVSINNTFDTFDDRFLGTFTTDPTHDNDGNAISVGAVYYNSVELATKFYNGSTWDDPSQSASTSATNALNSENAAAASETAAATSESNASTSETNSAASESAASTSEGNAATSATAASGSETSASNSATAAAASYDSFDDRYLGPKASEPTLDNDGNALLTGAIYWNAPESAMKVYTGSVWKPVTAFIEGVYEVTEFTNIAGQSTLTIEYDVGLAQVLYNGVQLNLSDFTATNGTTIVLATAVAYASDVITVMLWGAVTSSTLIGTAASKDTGTAAGELPTNADLATGAFTTVGTAATVNTGVTTGTLPFAEDVVLIQPSGNVGIGTNSPANTLSIKGTTNELDIETSATGVTLESIDRADDTKQSDMSFYARYGNHKFFSGAYTEKMRLDSAGNLLVGTTTESDWGTASGFRTRSSGSTTITRSAAPVLYANRLTSDGAIQEFLKDGTTVGSIGAYNGELVVSSTSGGDCAFRVGYNAIKPATVTGANADGVHNLGETSGRWKDLFLSGGVVFDDTGSMGTSSSTTLDSYEEGTWTPVLIGATSPLYATSSTAGTYTRVGNTVTCVGVFTLTSMTQNNGQVRIGGLPFTCYAGTNAGYAPVTVFPETGISYLNDGVTGITIVGTTYTAIYSETPGGLGYLTYAHLSDNARMRINVTYQLA